MITVIDYGVGNLRSIEKALAILKADFKISNKEKDVESASHIILPGVGFFRKGFNNLINLNLVNILTQEVLIKGKYFLGICLGMQLLYTISEEGGNNKGLGFVNGDINKFKFSNGVKLKVPHIGWNEVFGDEMSKMPIFKQIDPYTNFYFLHSYHAVHNENINYTYTDYGYHFVSAIQKDNIYGTQFHPEKSQKKGLQLLKNFIELG